MNEYQSYVYTALKSLIDNTSYLPDGNAQFPSELGDVLGKSMRCLSEWEDETYGIENMAENTKIRRENLSSAEQKIEGVIDAADKLYCGIFHHVLIPGAIYKTDACSPEGVDYCSKDLIILAVEAIKSFEEK